MIDVKCEGVKSTAKLSDMIGFQGNLKKRTEQEIDELGQSLKTDGLLMPFAIWPSKEGYKLLDGHGRVAALQKLALQYKEILDQKFPVILIDKSTEEEARKALLQITSSYGKITKKGAMEFTKTIPTYNAPAISRFVKYSNRTTAPKTVNKSTSIIRLVVPTEKLTEVKQILSTVEGIKVL